MDKHLAAERKANSMAVKFDQITLENLSNEELISAAEWLVIQEEPINKGIFKNLIRALVRNVRIMDEDQIEAEIELRVEERLEEMDSE